MTVLNITGEDLLKYIPQRAPMVMIDTIISTEENKATTGFSIQRDNLFIKNGVLSTMGLIENIAQSAAASAGYSMITNNEPIKVGFIGGLKNVQVEKWPAIGSKITTTITEKNNLMNITIVDGAVFQDGKSIASCELKIFLAENPTED